MDDKWMTNLLLDTCDNYVHIIMYMYILIKLG